MGMTIKGTRLKKFYKDYINLRSIIIFVMPLAISVLLFMLYNLSVTVENLSVSLIEQTIKKTETELDNFFHIVSEDVKITSQRGRTGLFYNLNPEILNPFFIPYIKNSKQVSSTLIGNSLGEE
jgi:hypothetical protein